MGTKIAGPPVVHLKTQLQTRAKIPNQRAESGLIARDIAGRKVVSVGSVNAIAQMQVQIVTQYRGQAPEEVERAISLPIEIGAVIVWRVVDTAEAVFEVDNYESYVTIQSEAALRNLATSYAYEEHGDENKGLTLRSNANEIALKLKQEVHERLQKAGVEVMEARLSHLAYSAEIAHAMLQRQQASAVLGARKIIVQGAVSIVQAALEQLKTLDVVELDTERKAAMVSNLLVVLCGDQKAQPVINAGSLY
jgi:hypothetical protein